MRKRSEAAPVQQSILPAEDQKVTEVPRLPIEENLSEICIEMQKRGYGLVRLTDVAGWLPQVRHIVAMWLAGQISEEDVPEAVKRFRGEKKDEHPYASLPPKEEVKNRRGSDDPERARKDALSVEDRRDSKKEEKPRASVDIQTLGKSLESVELVAGELLAPPDTITVGMGPEKYYPVAKSYNNFETGILSVTVHLKPGQGRLEAAREAYADLEVLRREFRERARVEYLRSLKNMLGDSQEKP